MINMMIDNISTLIEVTIVYSLLMVCLKSKYSRNRSIMLLIGLILVGFVLTNLSAKYCSQYTYIILIIGISLTAKLLFRERVIKICYFVSLAYYIIYFADVFSATLISMIFDMNIIDVTNMETSMGIFFYGCTKSIDLLLIYAYQKLFKRINLDIDDMYLWVMNIIVIVGITIISTLMNFIMGNMQFVNDQLTARKMLIILLLISVVICLVIYLFAQLSLFYQDRESKLNNRLTEDLLKNKIKHQQISEMALSHMRHDFKENIASISYMVQNNQTDEVLTYINNITDKIDVGKARILTGNVYIDAILNNNIEICKKKAIKLLVKADSVQDLAVQPLTLSNIITNMFKNAVAATEKLPEDLRLIEVKVFEYKQYVVINVKNTHCEKNLAQEVNFNKLSFLDGSRKGMGLDIIKKSVEKLDGQYKVKYDDQYFRTLIVLPKSE